MLLLPSQTTIRCATRRCRNAATTRITMLDRKGHVIGDPWNQCSGCTRACRLFELDQFEVAKGWTVRVEALTVCPVCAGDLTPDGRCTRFHQDVRWAKQPFSCDCFVCRVAGGDCASVFAHEAACENVAAHIAFNRALAGRALQPRLNSRMGWAWMEQEDTPRVTRGPGRGRHRRRHVRVQQERMEQDYYSDRPGGWCPQCAALPGDEICQDCMDDAQRQAAEDRAWDPNP